MLSRTKGREKLLAAFYQYLFYLPDPDRPTLKDIFMSCFSKEEKEADHFYQGVFLRAIEQSMEIIKEVTPLLNDWTFDRLCLTDQAIVILAAVEARYFDVPRAVVINVYVELTKKYGAQDDTYKFINGVLEELL